jgi:hypothetical protein
MAIYNPTNPPLFLSGRITSIVGLDQYPYEDSTGIKATGAYYTFEITVDQVTSQSIGTANSRSGNVKEYNGLDIKAGDWVTSENGQIVLKIESIETKSETSISFIAKDVDMIAYKLYASNYLTANSKLAFFEVSDNNVPLLTTGAVQSFFPTPASMDKIQGRFAAEEETERYRFEFSTSQTGYNPGDIITVSAEGEFVKLGTPGAAEVPVGLVLEKTMNDTVIYIKPFNTLIDNHSNPELLNGNAGEIYYMDPTVPGGITTTASRGAKALFLQVKDPVPTEVRATVSNYLPGSSDTVIFNEIPVFDGSSDEVSTVQDFVDLINASTDDHHITASRESEFSSLLSNASVAPNGVSVLALSDNTGASYTQIDVTISDGTNSTTVLFDQTTVPSPIAYPDAPEYLLVNAQIAADLFNAAFQADGLDLEAIAIIPGDGAYSSTFGQLKIQATTSTASISITTTDVDVLGDTFLSGFGIAASAPANGADFLILTRQDGGDLMITGNGTYINQNGITSSSAGSSAVLLMLEGVNDEPETGVNVSVDKNQVVASATTHDHYVTGINIDYTPFQDSDVIVKINGVEVNIGDGDNEDDCYFTDPTLPGYNTDGNAMVAKLIKDIAAGDVLIWNPTYAGYGLDPSDDIDVIYQASSYDL